MRERNDQKLGEVLREFFEQNPVVRQKVLESRTERAWGEVCGPTIMRYTRHLFLKGSVLNVSLTSAVLRNELLLSKASLIDAINKRVGVAVLTDIQLP